MVVIYKEDMKVPLKIWTNNISNIDKNCLEQSIAATKLPFIFHHMALMPDAHFGIGVSVGTVFPAKNVIIPSFVGSDIGCGMCFFSTNIPVASLRDVKTGSGELIHAMMANISRNVPTGFSKHKTFQSQNYPVLDIPLLGHDVIENERENAKYQLGTLGGGNHFIELQVNEEGMLCFMLHSGSRHLGLTIAKHYIQIAQDLNEKYHSACPRDMAFLPVDSEEGEDYLFAMEYALCFAAQNRKLMLERCKSIILNMVEKYVGITGVVISNEINAHHNYAALEHHYGENVWVHRKGAIRARAEEMGIIPGSCGTGSYIVKGNGNAESFMSASHGSGRRYGRKEAQRSIDLTDHTASLKGIITTNNINRLVDESPLAYKDIHDVINNESDLVTPVMKLKPVAFLKGEGDE